MLTRTPQENPPSVVHSKIPLVILLETSSRIYMAIPPEISPKIHLKNATEISEKPPELLRLLIQIFSQKVVLTLSQEFHLIFTMIPLEFP